MKQLVFSYVDPKVSAIMVSYGEVTDGAFKALELDGRLDFLFSSASRLIHDEPIFHSGYYILPKDFNEVFEHLMIRVDSIAYYPGFLVCNLNSDCDGPKKEKE